MCSRHFQQAQRGKRPFILPGRFPRTATAEERFWAKVNKTDTCWLWTAATMKNGYGVFDNNPASFLAHHFLVGRPPDRSLEWDHLCFVRNCVRPDHLQLVTRTENHARQRSHGPKPNQSTHCKHGHPWDEVNTHVLPNGRHTCKACGREAMRRCRAKQPPREFCKDGHRLDEENTLILSNGKRGCRTCFRKTKIRTAPLKENCHNGHPYDDENTYVDPHGNRACRACRRERLARHYRRKRQKIS